MNKTITILIFFFIHFTLCDGFDEAFSQKILKGIDMAYNDNLLPALKYFKELEKEYPDNPAPLFLQMASIEKIQVDYMSDYLENEFGKTAEKATRITERYITLNPSSADGYFFLGGIQGYYGLHVYRMGHKMGVFMEGLKAIKNLKKAYDLDPTLWDTYYGLGCYYYWKAAKAPFLYFLQSSRDHDRQEGLEMLKMAAEKGLYGKMEARSALIRSLLNEERYDEALKYVEEGLAGYPRWVAMLRFRQEIHFHQKNWLGIYEDSQRLEKLLAEKPYTGPDAWVHLYFFKGTSALELEKTEEALSYFNMVIKLCKIHKNQIEINKQLLSVAKKKLKKIRKARNFEEDLFVHLK